MRRRNPAMLLPAQTMHPVSECAICAMVVKGQLRVVADHKPMPKPKPPKTHYRMHVRYRDSGITFAISVRWPHLTYRMRTAYFHESELAVRAAQWGELRLKMARQ